MEQKKNKYDTNPLDPEVARRTDDAWGAARSTARGESTSETEDMMGATRDIGLTPQSEARRDPGAEAPTRRYDTPPAPSSYPSVFVPPAYQPPSVQGGHGIYGDAFTAPTPKPAHATANFNSPPTSRPIQKMNLPENVATILPYLPFPFIGALAGAIELFLVPRGETRVRFHAAQGLALHLIVVAVSVLTSTTDNLLRGPALVMLTIASGLFSLAAFIFFIISMIRVWKGEPHVITSVAELTRWLDEKIEPRK